MTEPTTKIYVGFALNAVDPEKYAGWDGMLKAAEYDIHDFEDFAKKQGFECHTFLGERATVGNLKAAIQLIKNRVIKDDALVWFNFSGHGGQILGKETLCLYDGQVLDTDLKDLLQSISNVRIVGLFDCCHSGGLDRAYLTDDLTAANLRRKAMPPDYAIALANNVRRVKRPLSITLSKSPIKYLCACGEDESAYDGEKNGLFTAAVKAVLRGVPPPTYAQLMSKAAQYTANMQHPKLVTIQGNKQFSDSAKAFE